jgi:hypothetical protein
MAARTVRRIMPPLLNVFVSAAEYPSVFFEDRPKGQRMNPVTRREVLKWAAGALLNGATAALAAAGDRLIISGASGQLGGQAIRDLLERGVAAKNLILVSRTPEALAQYARIGAATRFGDFSKPDSLPTAFAGGTRMLLISIGGGAGPRPVAHGHAIEAAKSAGVKQIAYTSWLGIRPSRHGGAAAPERHRLHLPAQLLIYGDPAAAGSPDGGRGHGARAEW